MEPIERLFVYGTLCPGEVNHHVLANVTGTWEPATITGELLDQGWGAEFGCKGIVPSEDGEPVSGYIFSSGRLSEQWAILDEFEGSEYQRVPAVAKLASGKEINVQVYALNNARCNC